MERTHDLRLRIYDKRVCTMLDTDLKRLGIFWDVSYNDYSGYYYYIIELVSPAIKTVLNDLVSVYILYFAMMDVFKDDFKARTEIQRQFGPDASHLLDSLGVLCL